MRRLAEVHAAKVFSRDVGSCREVSEGTVNPFVVGSSPTPGAKRNPCQSPVSEVSWGSVVTGIVSACRACVAIASPRIVLFRFMMVVVVPVGVFQVRDALSGVGRRCFGSCATPACSMLL